jgi:predicted secreted protein
MSDNRLRFIRGHVDALRDLCGDMRDDSMPARAVDLLKSKVDEAAKSQDTGAYYKAGYEVTRSVASWIDLMMASAKDGEPRGKRAGRGTSVPIVKSKPQPRKRGGKDSSV